MSGGYKVINTRNGPYKGVSVDEDTWALSELIQWVFRSAIRENKEINVYIPSERMRNLLVEWLNK